MKKHLTFLFIISVAIGYGTIQWIYLDLVDEIEVLSLIFEGSVALLILYGIFVLENIKSRHNENTLLMTGLVSLFFSMMTDACDEFLQHPDVLTIFFEDIFQLIGFIFLVFGIRQWARRENEDV